MFVPLGEVGRCLEGKDRWLEEEALLRKVSKRRFLRKRMRLALKQTR